MVSASSYWQQEKRANGATHARLTQGIQTVHAHCVSAFFSNLRFAMLLDPKPEARTTLSIRQAWKGNVPW
jgi:hypothetical protein